MTSASRVAAPILMLSPSGQPAAIGTALQNGADDDITTQFRPVVT
jgi:hypothetical protein